MITMRSKTVAATLILVSLFLAGCTQKVAGLVNPKSESTFTKNPKLAVEEIAIPIYPNSKLVAGGIVQITDRSKAPNFNYTLESSDKMDTVLKWYRTQLPKHIFMSGKKHGFTSYTLKLADKRQVQITDTPRIVKIIVCKMDPIEWAQSKSISSNGGK